MKRLIPLAALALTLAATPFLAAPGGLLAGEEESLLEELDWMCGRWAQDGGGQYIEEMWSGPGHGAMVGCLRWARGGDVWLYELVSIEEDEEHGLVFYLRHFDRELVPWKSEKDGPLSFPLENYDENSVSFANPERDQPHRLVYERSGKDLTIRLENQDDSVQATFRMRLQE